jgi:uncharacterized membrane protein
MADQGPTATAGIPAVGATDDERMKGALAYVLSILTGIIVLIVAGDNKFLKFHAWQSIIFGIVLWVVTFVLSFICIGPIIGFVGWLYTLYGAYLVYTGKPFRIPVIADFTENTFCK